jgi:hypothetical protein
VTAFKANKIDGKLLVKIASAKLDARVSQLSGKELMDMMLVSDFLNKHITNLADRFAIVEAIHALTGTASKSATRNPSRARLETNPLTSLLHKRSNASNPAYEAQDFLESAQPHSQPHAPPAVKTTVPVSSAKYKETKLLFLLLGISLLFTVVWTVVLRLTLKYLVPTGQPYATICYFVLLYPLVGCLGFLGPYTWRICCPHAMSKRVFWRHLTMLQIFGTCSLAALSYGDIENILKRASRTTYLLSITPYYIGWMMLGIFTWFPFLHRNKVSWANSKVPIAHSA